jgi:hypothetical protein
LAEDVPPSIKARIRLPDHREQGFIWHWRVIGVERGCELRSASS